MYSEYFLGANRFILSIHDLTRSQIADLESLTHTYLKRWLGLPRGASWALVHDIHGLNIKSIEHLYKESRSLTLSNIRFYSDSRIRHALDSKEEREGKWCRKFSSSTFVKGLIEEVVTPVVGQPVLTLDNNLDDSSGSWSSLELEEAAAAPPPPPPPPQGVMRQSLLKKKIQVGVQARVNDFWKEKIGHYVMQGDYLALIMEEGGCITWRSYLYDIPRGVLKFAINAGLNTLPSLDNLKRWGKRVSDRCSFCGNTQTLLHILSNCPVSLDQGRYTWRHNSVLASLIRIMRPCLNQGMEIFSDLPGYLAPGGGSIPPDVLVTNQRPDIFIVNYSSREAIVLELTCPWDGNVDRSHTYKEERYAPLIADLSRHYKTFLFSIEVSVRGQITGDNKKRLKAFIYRSCVEPKSTFKSVVPVLSKVALFASFSVCSARNEPSWSNPHLLTHC